MTVYLNGKIVEEGEAVLSAFDAGVQHGVGLFETMRVYNGRAFRLREHVARLVGSARELGLTDRLREGALCEAVELAVERSGLADARVRLTVTGGDLSLLAAARGGGDGEDGGGGGIEHQPSVLIHVGAATVYPPVLFEKGALVTLADFRANPLDPTAGHKTLNYWQRLRELAGAAAKGAAEGLVATVTNHLASGCVSNLFVVRDGVLVTPPARGEEEGGALPSPVLPGVTRGAVIEAAEGLGMGVERRWLTLEDGFGAEEMFLTNSSFLVLPVVRVERHEVGDGKVGGVTRRVYDRLAELVVEGCGGDALDGDDEV